MNSYQMVLHRPVETAGVSGKNANTGQIMAGTVWGSGISEKVVWWVMRQYAKIAAIEKLSPHDLRRTCARLCHSTGGELEQIQFLLGHRSVETTERYLGSRQRILYAVNDKLGIEPDIGSG
jgi:site-specific recombinase XerD